MEASEFEKKYDAVPDLDDFSSDSDSDSDSDSGEELLAEQDIIDAIALLTRCKTLLDYHSDKELSEKLLKKDREIMAKVAEQVGDWLDSVAPNYEEA